MHDSGHMTKALTGLATAILVAGSLVPCAAAAEEKVPSPKVTKTVCDSGHMHAQVGSSLSYCVSATVTSDLLDSDDVSGVKVLDAHDPSIVLDLGSVAVSVDGQPLAPPRYDTSNKDNLLAIDIPDIKSIDGIHDGSTVTITYDAVLDTNATCGATPNANVAWMEWGPDGRTEQVEAKVSTFALTIQKEDSGTSPLEGAEFTIKSSSGQYVQADGSLGDAEQRLTSDKKGNIKVRGIDSGTYTITETAAPSGYEAVDPFDVTIDADYDPSGTVQSLSASATAPDEAATITSTDATSGTVTVTVHDKSTAEAGRYGKTGIDVRAVQTVSVACVLGGIILAIEGRRLRRDDPEQEP